MLEGVRATTPRWVPRIREGLPAPPQLAGDLLPEAIRAYVVPAVMALLCVLGLSLSVTRLGLLLDWSDRYDGTGEHIVVGCRAGSSGGGDVWACDGALVPDGSVTDVQSELVASRGAVSSHQPYVGQRTEVFYDRDDLGTAHPVASRLNELARLYLSLLPRLLLFGGAAIWLAGWYLTRRVDERDLIEQDAVRLPGRFAWRARGSRWLVVAAGLVVANHFLTTRVIGSLGTF